MPLGARASLSVAHRWVGLPTSVERTLRWNRRPGEWHVHGGLLRVRTPEHDCEGAIDDHAAYILCAAGRDSTMQFVLTFAPDA